MDLRSISEWLTGGSRQYHDLVHCMGHDHLWIAVTVVLDLAVACGYIVIAGQWWRNEKRLADGPSKQALRRLKQVFLLCGLCGYLFIPIKMFWPAWRLYDLVMLVLAYSTWRYAWGARGLAVVYTELGRVAQLGEELQKSRANEAHLEGRVRELSEIERMAAALRESEQRFRLLVDGVQDYAIFMLDPDGRVASWNTGAERMTGYAPEEILGRNYSCFYPEDERQACGHARDQANAATGRFEEEGWRVRKDGSRFLADAVTTAVRDPEGTLRGFATVVRDVTELRRAADAIMDGEMRYARIVETAQEGIWTIDAQARTTYVNRRLAEMLGYSAEEMLGRPMYDFMDDAARAEAERNLERRRMGVREQHDFRFRRKDGSDLWTICSANPMLGEGGKFEGALAMVIDITDRKRAEGAVRESEEKYRTLVANIPDVTWRADLTGRTTFISENVKQAFGFTAEEVMAAGEEVWLGRIHPDDAGQVGAAFAALFSEGQKFDVEYRIRHKDDRWIWVHDRAYGTQTVSGVAYADGIFTDVTERKLAEEALRHSEQRFHLFMRNLPGVAFMKDERGRYVYVNATFEAVSGKRFGDVAGKGDHECWPAEIARRFTETDRVVRTRMAPLQTVETFPQDDGVHHWLSTKFPVVTDDGRTLLGGVAVDVTAAKRAEEVERERNHLKGAVSAMEQVLGVVGHELRTPIAGMRAISEFLLNDGAKGTAEFDKLLNQLNAETFRMGDVVDELLEAARLNSGQARWNWSTVRLAVICDEALQSVRALVDEDQVQVTFEVDPPESTMRGDADAVRRLVVNLANNARKHTAAGSIHVAVRRCHDAGAEWVEIRVRDTGAGIPPEILERLGEAFALNSGVVGASNVSGTGLGLAICKRIAAAHGGTLHVDSTVGQGATVTAHLRSDLLGAVVSGGKGLILSGMRSEGDEAGSPAKRSNGPCPLKGRAEPAAFASVADAPDGD